MKTLYGVTIALSAFLLFSIELISTRVVLPLLGGSSAVWISALSFFQFTLLLGYAYAVLLERAASRRPASLLGHLTLILLAAALLVVPAPAGLHLASGSSPQLRLFALLGVSVGLPFLVLSTTSPLLQSWYARRENTPVPYRLFAVSNFSSLLALLAYPLVIEPRLELHTQQRLWRFGFLLYLGLTTVLTLRVRQAQKVGLTPLPSPGMRAALRQTPSRHRILWIALPAVASFQLAAVTAHLAQDVAPMPLLWVLPLSVYIGSFVLAFEFPKFYRRGVLVRLLAVLLLALGYFLSRSLLDVPIGLTVILFTAELLVATWFLHAEFYSLRPQHAAATTVFYLAMAFGATLGTVAVAIVSPSLFDSNFDLPIAFTLTAALALIVTFEEGWPQRVLWAGVTGLGIVLLTVLQHTYTEDALLRGRNFYGPVRVTENQLPPQAVTSRILYNGSIQHGMQWFAEDFRRTPLTYYARDSGVGLALDHCCADRPRRIGIIGLGTGTLAAFGRPGDTIRFYEINPLVITVARNLFTYIRESPATISVVPGDARLTLSAEPAQHFDVLVVDAFSGDSIPVHLLTREALDLYRRHLAPGGIIAFHVSNKYLDLPPVIERLAESTGTGAAPALYARQIDTEANDSRGEFAASWVLLTADQNFFLSQHISGVARTISTPSGIRLWTDQYSTLLPIIHWSGTPPPAAAVAARPQTSVDSRPQ